MFSSLYYEDCGSCKYINCILFSRHNIDIFNTQLSPEGKIVKEGFMMGVNLMFEGAPDKAKTAEEIIDACVDITDPEM